MVDSAIIDYVRREESEGYTPDQIRDVLLQQGYAEDDVRAAFDAAHGTSPKPAGNKMPSMPGSSAIPAAAYSAWEGQGTGGGSAHQRPVSISVIAMLFLLSGIAGWVSGLGLMLNVGTEPFANVPLIGGYLASAFQIMVLVILFIGAMNLISGWGLWNLKNWGRMIAIILMSISLIFIITIPISIVFLYFLMNKDARAAFGV